MASLKFGLALKIDLLVSWEGFYVHHQIAVVLYEGTHGLTSRAEQEAGQKKLQTMQRELNVKRLPFLFESRYMRSEESKKV